ncbi:unnamed protein product [Arabidopsis lyrata]|nr:unnamed protein product [Arabidopsis lyrata]
MIEEYSDAYYDSLMPCLLNGAPLRFISVVTSNKNSSCDVLAMFSSPNSVFVGGEG